MRHRGLTRPVFGTSTVVSIALLVLVQLTACSDSAEDVPAPLDSVWDGVYTEAQAAAGAAAYLESCASCHNDDLSGTDTANALIGPPFTFRWQGLSVGDLVKLLRATMPPDAPGSLDAERYAAIVAYLLQANDYPAGSAALSTDEANLLLLKFSDEPGG